MSGADSSKVEILVRLVFHLLYLDECSRNESALTGGDESALTRGDESALTR